MPTEYVEDKEITDAMIEMLEMQSFTEFNPIREHEVKIDACLCVRTNSEGENAEPKAEPVALKKVGPVEKVFLDTEYILVVDNSAWTQANDIQRKAMIHRGLMKINIETKDGQIKVGTRKPDIIEFTATAARFGAYNEPLLAFKEAIATAAVRVAKTLQLENAGQ